MWNHTVPRNACIGRDSPSLIWRRCTANHTVPRNACIEHDSTRLKYNIAAVQNRDAVGPLGLPFLLCTLILFPIRLKLYNDALNFIHAHIATSAVLLFQPATMP
jgi:hypothetical protein